MPTWTEPASTSLSSNDIRRMHTGLTGTDSRDDALAFLDRLRADYLYVIAADIAYHGHLPKPDVHQTADGYRAWIRNHI
jgi:hypothetical protein